MIQIGWMSWREWCEERIMDAECKDMRLMTTVKELVEEMMEIRYEFLEGLDRRVKGTGVFGG